MLRIQRETQNSERDLKLNNDIPIKMRAVSQGLFNSVQIGVQMNDLALASGRK